VRGGQIASAGLALTALIVGVGLLASWLASESAPIEFAPQASAAPAAPPLATEVRSLSAATERAPFARTEAELDEPIQGPAKAPRCPDLDAILKELCDLLEQPEGAFAPQVEPRLDVWRADLDQHCVSILESRVSAPRPTVERLAALLLLRVAPPSLHVARLGASESFMLWRLFDVNQPDDVLSPSAIVGDEERSAHRRSVARLAAKCLAVLAGEQDLARLTAWLDDNGAEGGFVRYAFHGVRSAALSNAVLARLADPSRPMGHAAYVMDSQLAQPGVELDPDLRERAARSLLERWRANGVEEHDLELTSRILGKLDPTLLAERWGELQDQGAVGPHGRLAAAAWAESSSPADLSHLDGWLGAEGSAERINAARAVLLHARDGVPIADLRNKAAAALCDLAQNCPEAGVRREALFIAKAAPEVIASIASRALYDEDATVREAAVLTAQHLVAEDADLRARFERAAASDTDERVRRAAAHALR
jgi:hypothetical protein